MFASSPLARRFLPAGIVLAGLLGMIVMMKARPAVTAEPREIVPPTVEVVSINPGKQSAWVTAYGEVVPTVRTTLNSDVAGTVIHIAPGFVSGGTFAKGDLLYSLDPTDYDLAVASAQARFEQARIAYESEEIESAVAAAEREALGAPGETPLATRERQQALASANLAAAKADLARAMRDRHGADRRAPFDGRVERADIGLGQYVGKGNVTGVIYSVEAMEVRLPVPDEALGRLSLPLTFVATKKKPGLNVVFSATFGGEERTWTGRIVRVEGSVDPKSRMVTLVGRADAPTAPLSGALNDFPLTPGMFVKGEIEGEPVDDALLLSPTALREGNRLAIVTGEKTITLIPATLLWRTEEGVAVKADVTADTRIVVSPLDHIEEGMKVKIASEDRP